MEGKRMSSMSPVIRLCLFHDRYGVGIVSFAGRFTQARIISNGGCSHVTQRDLRDDEKSITFLDYSCLVTFPRSRGPMFRHHSRAALKARKHSCPPLENIKLYNAGGV